MTYNCITCGFTGKDNYDLKRHNETKKHMEAISFTTSEEEVEDFRNWSNEETNKYIINHKWFIKADPVMADYKRKQARFREILDKLENNKLVKSPSEKQRQIQKIKDEYPDVESDEDEDEDIQNERLRRIEALDYSLSQNEIENLIIEKDTLLLFLCERQKDGCHLRHVALREKIRDKMIAFLNNKDKQKRLDEMKEQDNIEKLEKQKLELELKIKLLELKMKK